MCGSTPVVSKETVSGGEAEQYIKTSEAQWAESVATNDASVVKRILADDVVWVLDDKAMNKKRAVTDALTAGNYFASDHLEYAHVRFFGHTALVQGSEIWKRKDGRAGRFIWTDTWILRKGQWQIVSAQDTIVPMHPRVGTVRTTSVWSGRLP